MEKPLVSIVCTAYNHEKYIRNCMDGFLIQETNFSFEVLINEDASTDRTADIIKEYQERFPGRFKPIYQTENQYSKKAGLWRTILFPKAQGKYIALCEGDDYWIDPLKLQKQVDFLEENSEYSMCFHNAWVVYENSDKSILFRYLEEREYTGSEILKEWIVPTASVVFRKDCIRFEDLGNSKFVHRDIVLFLSLAEYGKLMAINQAMSVYRRHEGSASYGESSIKQIKSFIEHHKMIAISFCGKYKKIEKQNIGNSYFELFYKYFKRRSFKCLGAFVLSVYYSPVKTFVNLGWVLCIKLRLKSQVTDVFRG